MRNEVLWPGPCEGDRAWVRECCVEESMSLRVAAGTRHPPIRHSRGRTSRCPSSEWTQLTYVAPIWAAASKEPVFIASGNERACTARAAKRAIFNWCSVVRYRLPTVINHWEFGLGFIMQNDITQTRSYLWNWFGCFENADGILLSLTHAHARFTTRTSTSTWAARRRRRGSGSGSAFSTRRPRPW
jgi:hypothetical protein